MLVRANSCTITVQYTSCDRYGRLNRLHKELVRRIQYTTSALFVHSCAAPCLNAAHQSNVMYQYTVYCSAQHMYSIHIQYTVLYTNRKQHSIGSNSKSLNWVGWLPSKLSPRLLCHFAKITLHTMILWQMPLRRSNNLNNTNADVFKIIPQAPWLLMS